MFVKLPGPRHTSTDSPDGLCIRIPAKRNIFIVLFLSLWLCGWFVGEVSALAMLVKTGVKQPPVIGFLLIWLCGWTAGGAFAIYTWLWQVKGCEVVTINPQALCIKREILGRGRTKHYDISEIRNFRAAPQVYNPFDFRSGMAFWGVGGGILAFDYGFKTFRFAAGVDEAEARIILQKIIERFPQLGPRT